MYDSEMPDLKKLGKNQLTDFYEECVNKGFHHVDDPEQKKQIELLAMESGINYGSIDDLYEKSKQEYLAYKKNCEEAKKRQAAQSVIGRLIFSVATKYTQNSKRSSVGVYIRPDGSIYCELSAGWHRKYKHETRVEGIRFTAKEFSGGMFTYSPSKTIYTGATVGGVTTGGLHQTQAGYDFKYKKTGQGYITVRFGEEEEEIVTYIQLNSYGSFLYDGRYKDGRINCLRCSGDNSMGKAAMRTGNIYQVANAASAQMSLEALSMQTCVNICDFINWYTLNIYPYYESEKEIIYEAAQSFADSKTVEGLYAASRMFLYIKDYNDASDRALKYHADYQNALEEKSRNDAAIAAQEQEKSKGKMVIGIIVSIVCLAFIIYCFAGS